MHNHISSQLESAKENLKKGSFVCILDDISSTTCSYLLTPAETISIENVNFLVNNARGIIMCPMEQEFSNLLGLSPLGNLSKDPFPITIGVEARSGITTGISSADRAESLSAICNFNLKSKSIIAPGHIFPLISKNGGLLVKSGISETCTDLLKFSNLKQVGALSHILNAEGELASEEEVRKLTNDFKIPLLKISEIIQYRLRTEPIISKVASSRLPMDKFGDFTAHCYVSKHDGAEHLVLTKNLPIKDKKNPVLVRMHSERKFGDLILTTKDESRNKLNSALIKIQEKDQGALVYIRKHKTSSLSGQLKKLAPSISNPITSTPSISNSTDDTITTDSLKATELRELGVGAQMLLDLQIEKLALLTSSKKPLIDLSAFGLTIEEQVLI